MPTKLVFSCSAAAGVLSVPTDSPRIAELGCMRLRLLGQTWPVELAQRRSSAMRSDGAPPSDPASAKPGPRRRHQVTLSKILVGVVIYRAASQAHDRASSSPGSGDDERCLVPLLRVMSRSSSLIRRVPSLAPSRMIRLVDACHSFVRNRDQHRINKRTDAFACSPLLRYAIP